MSARRFRIRLSLSTLRKSLLTKCFTNCGGRSVDTPSAFTANRRAFLGMRLADAVLDIPLSVEKVRVPVQGVRKMPRPAEGGKRVFGKPGKAANFRQRRGIPLRHVV